MNRIYQLIAAALIIAGFSQTGISQEYKYSDNWSVHGLTLAKESPENIRIDYSTAVFVLEDIRHQR